MAPERRGGNCMPEKRTGVASGGGQSTSEVSGMEGDAAA